MIIYKDVDVEVAVNITPKEFPTEELIEELRSRNTGLIKDEILAVIQQLHDAHTLDRVSDFEVLFKELCYISLGRVI